jgi:hypothetical protein
MGRPTKRKLLKRPGVPLEIWGNFLVAATIACSGVVLLLISIFRGGGGLSLLISLVLIVASAPALVSLWRVLGRPKTYAYEDIVDVQKVDIPLGRSAW